MRIKGVDIQYNVSFKASDYELEILYAYLCDPTNLESDPIAQDQLQEWRKFFGSVTLYKYADTYQRDTLQ